MKIKIGVDGGGTKTELIAIDPTGVVLACHHAVGCNPSIVGAERAEQILREALATLLVETAKAQGLHDVPEPIVALLCMAGNRTFWREQAAKLQGLGEVTAMDDAAPVVELATLGGAGMALHAGTGSFVAARLREGIIHYAGGLGWRLGDDGSAYDLGKRAAARALLELQGWEAQSPLGAEVCRVFGEDQAVGLSRRIYQSPEVNAELGALALHVSRFAEEGDETALRILADSLAGLAQLASRVHRKLFSNGSGAVRCGLSGPILTGVAAQRVLRAALTEDFSLNVVTERPIEGVRRLLLKHG